METLSRLAGATLVSTFMLQMGLALAPNAIREELRHAGRLLRGLVFFLVVTPLLGWFVASAFRADPPAVVALVLLSCVGVAPLAARSARAAGGSICLAIVLTFLLGALTIVTAPPTAQWLLGYAGDRRIDPPSLIPQLALLEVAPLLLGILIRRMSTRASSVEKVVSTLNTVAFVVVVGLIIVPHLHSLSAPGWQGGAAAIVLSILAAVAGYYVGGSGEGGRTLAAMANTPNVSLALGIVTSVDAPPVFAVTIAGTFLLRLIMGAFVKRIVARRGPDLEPNLPDGILSRRTPRAREGH